MNAAVQPLLALWPVQNGPELGGGIAEAFSSPLQRIREDFGTTRLDYNISNKDLLFGVYTIDDSDANTPTANPLSSVVESLREQVVNLQEQQGLFFLVPDHLRLLKARFVSKTDCEKRLTSLKRDSSPRNALTSAS